MQKKSSKFYKPWDESTLQKLKNLFDDFSYDELAILLQRPSGESVRKQANKLGLVKRGKAKKTEKKKRKGRPKKRLPFFDSYLRAYFIKRKRVEKKLLLKQRKMKERKWCEEQLTEKGIPKAPDTSRSYKFVLIINHREAIITCSKAQLEHLKEKYKAYEYRIIES